MRSLARAALIVACALGFPASASFHLWTMAEFYSNAAGNVQFLELSALSGGQQFLTGHTLTSSNGVTTHSFTFLSDLPGDTTGKRMLIGTQSFANLGIVTPDYVVPDNFFFTANFTINWAEFADVWTSTSGPPTDGVRSLARNGSTAPNSPLNFAGQTKTVTPPRMQADMDGNGRSDLLWRNVSTGQVYRHSMNGFAIAGENLAYTEPDTAWQVVADADFNGDGVSDLLWRNSTTGQVYLMPFAANGMPAPGAFIYTEPNASWRIVGAPDINGDGKADLLWWNASTGMVYLMLMDGGTITHEGVVYTEPNTTDWHIVAVGDFAGSGKQNQLLWRNQSTGQVYLMTVLASNPGFSQTGQFIYQEPNTAWSIVGVADFNGDLRSDILWRNSSTGQVYVMLMNGPQIANQALVYTEADMNWSIVAQGDYDGDFKADILWRHAVTGQVYMLKMNGLSIAAGSFVYQEANSAWRLLGPKEYGTQAYTVALPSVRGP